ncbi:MAG: CDGSH iron-sulfur domain-containing protein [Anaerolineae bacterium]|nr:CDGSH iron-sulfur domain-containing protein [Anaerolineae bacterium]
MADKKYTGSAMDRRYRSDTIDIAYNARRCIHAEECVHHLRAVFDNRRTPWIDPNGAPADQIAEVIHLCPSGALHYERKDGGAGEPTPTANTIRLWVDGPIEIRGDLHISGAHVEIADETRVTLCRCGASDNKPFCDNAHLKSGFQAADPPAKPGQALTVTGGKLHIEPEANGPLYIRGSMTILNDAGEVIFAGEETWLCRCGHSTDKPFCNSMHRQVGFVAD